MSDVHGAVWKQIEELRDAGVEPDRVVVPSEEWDAFKDRAEVREDDDAFGGVATYVNDVRAFHNSPKSAAEVIVYAEADDE